MQPIASFRRRIAANIYDGLLLMGVLICAAFIALFLFGESFIDHQNSGPLYSAYLIAIALGFFCICWVVSGQTLGARTWQIKVVDKDGKLPSWPQSILRFFVAILSLVFFGLGFFWMLLRKDRRTWHDLASKTFVIRT